MNGHLYARAGDGIPFNHVTEMGQAGFQGLGLRAESVEDLQRSLPRRKPLRFGICRLRVAANTSCLRDPDGFLVEVVAGQDFTEPAEMPLEPLRNSAAAKTRRCQPVRLSSGPSHVLRLGHCVLNVSEFRTSERWYKERFGFITSDEIEAASGLAIGAFMRCDRGDQPTDHHTLFLAQLPQKPGFMHAAFEVAGLDDLMLGHAHSKIDIIEKPLGVSAGTSLAVKFLTIGKTLGGMSSSIGQTAICSQQQMALTQRPLMISLAVQWGMQNPIFSGRLAPSPGLVSLAIATSARIKRLFRKKRTNPQ